MKKALIALSAAVCLVSFSTAFAEDDASTGDASALFKSHCQACHGADGGRAPVEGMTPIKGQKADELLTMLMGYKDGAFGGAKKQVMVGVVKRLSDDQIKELADYASKL